MDILINPHLNSSSAVKIELINKNFLKMWIDIKFRKKNIF